MKGMVSVLCVAVAALIASPAAGAEYSLETWSDDFEAYDVGSLIMGQDEWTTWDDDATVNSTISDVEASSGEKSLLISGSADIVHEFSDVTSGFWEIKAKVYIPSSQIGGFWFILMNTYVAGTDNPKNWSAQIGMFASDGTVRDAGGSDYGGAGNLPILVTDDWAEVACQIDLDANTYSVTYNGILVHNSYTWSGAAIALAAVDLWGENSSDVYVDDISLTKICLPAHVVREVTTPQSTRFEGIDAYLYSPGETLSVLLPFLDVRAASGECPAAGDVTVVEMLPADWSATAISGGGTFADGKITWTVPAANLATTTLTYEASGPVTTPLVELRGTYTEKDNPFVFNIPGPPIPTSRLLAADGSILAWLLLGPYMHTAGMTTNAALIRLDYLTDDADNTEATVMPAEGDEIDTQYDVAASIGLAGASGSYINPGGIPEWFVWRDRDVQISFDDVNSFGAVDTVMAYAVCYICAKEDMQAILMAGSDDSLQIILNDEEVWIYPVDRAWPGLVDIVQIDLKKGVNRLMAKIFENAGGWNFGISLTDINGDAFTDDSVLVTLDPEGCGAPPPLFTFKRGDANDDGKRDIADAIKVLGYLFGGGATQLGCLDAGDANDDGKVDIADAIKILGHLFAQAGPLPEPFDECGEDPTDTDPLDCQVHATCGTGV